MMTKRILFLSVVGLLLLNSSQNVEAIEQAKKQLPQDFSKIDMHMLQYM